MNSCAGDRAAPMLCLRLLETYKGDDNPSVSADIGAGIRSPELGAIDI